MVVSFLLIGLSDSASYSTICFVVMKYVISKTFDKEIWGGTKPQWRYSRFLVMAINEGLVGFEIWMPGFFLGRKIWHVVFFSLLDLN